MQVAAAARTPSVLSNWPPGLGSPPAAAAELPFVQNCWALLDTGGGGAGAGAAAQSARAGAGGAGELPERTTVVVYVHGWRQGYLRCRAAAGHLESVLLGACPEPEPEHPSQPVTATMAPFAVLAFLWPSHKNKQVRATLPTQDLLLGTRPPLSKGALSATLVCTATSVNTRALSGILSQSYRQAVQKTGRAGVLLRRLLEELTERRGCRCVLLWARPSKTETGSGDERGGRHRGRPRQGWAQRQRGTEQKNSQRIACWSRTVVVLPELLCRHDRRVVLVGHSLGCRVSLEALHSPALEALSRHNSAGMGSRGRAAAEMPPSTLACTVVLLAPAVADTALKPDGEYAATGLRSGEVVALHSSRDEVLGSGGFGVGEALAGRGKIFGARSALGLVGPAGGLLGKEEGGGVVRAVDVSAEVGQHSAHAWLGSPAVAAVLEQAVLGGAAMEAAGGAVGAAMRESAGRECGSSGRARGEDGDEGSGFEESEDDEM